MSKTGLGLLVHIIEPPAISNGVRAELEKGLEDAKKAVVATKEAVKKK